MDNVPAHALLRLHNLPSINMWACVRVNVSICGAGGMNIYVYMTVC